VTIHDKAAGINTPSRSASKTIRNKTSQHPITYQTFIWRLSSSVWAKSRCVSRSLSLCWSLTFSTVAACDNVRRATSSHRFCRNISANSIDV